MIGAGAGAAIGGAIGGGTGLIGSAISARMARQDARESRKWQERMSSTAYQRATGDLRKAGLNPMLAYMQGGASTPPGAMPSYKGIDLGGPEGAAAALGILKLRNESRMVGEQANKIAAETKAIDAKQPVLDIQRDVYTELHKALKLIQSGYHSSGTAKQTNNYLQNLGAAGGSIMDFLSTLSKPLNDADKRPAQFYDEPMGVNRR